MIQKNIKGLNFPHSKYTKKEKQFTKENIKDKLPRKRNPKINRKSHRIIAFLNIVAIIEAIIIKVRIKFNINWNNPKIN